MLWVVSKVLFPALRLGYLVVPENLVAAFTRASRLHNYGPSTLDQRVVAAGGIDENPPAFQKHRQVAQLRRHHVLDARRRGRLGVVVGIEPAVR